MYFFSSHHFSRGSFVDLYVSPISSILVVAPFAPNLSRLIRSFLPTFLRYPPYWFFLVRYPLIFIVCYFDSFYVSPSPKISVLLVFIPSSDNRSCFFYDSLSSLFSFFSPFSQTFIFFLRIFLQYLYLSFFLHDSYFSCFFLPFFPLRHIFLIQLFSIRFTNILHTVHFPSLSHFSHLLLSFPRHIHHCSFSISSFSSGSFISSYVLPISSILIGILIFVFFPTNILSFFSFFLSFSFFLFLIKTIFLKPHFHLFSLFFLSFFLSFFLFFLIKIFFLKPNYFPSFFLSIFLSFFLSFFLIKIFFLKPNSFPSFFLSIFLSFNLSF
ncbi:unnamed protein product [Acanthosepion pharaonis]|uniref:Uncharacterized protein n=1 Tax=Acanthosepion pharaonis TaxID=158019 RepID=A0A812CKW0_ACAPH|nr:unnamed protein product [Sepia pharaonis]